MVLGGVHGNELTGIEVVKELVDGFSNGTLRLASGTLTLALGNPRAIALNERATDPYLDLNRSFLAETIAHPTAYEHERAAELAPLIAEADMLIDLHATNKPTKPFVIATSVDAARVRLARRFACDSFVVAPDAVIGGTTDGWAAMHGGSGIGFESGLMTDVTKVANTRMAVLKTLDDLGMIAAKERNARTFAKDVIHIESAVPYSGIVFEFAAGKGLASFEPFAKGEILGFMDGKSIITPYDGLLMFPKPKHLGKPGLPVAFLARPER